MPVFASSHFKNSVRVHIHPKLNSAKAYLIHK